MKFAATALLLGFAAIPSATAQTVMGTATLMPSPPSVGATVVDTAGAAVGTIESMTTDMAVINTGTTKASYPLASMTPGPNGPIIAMTKAQLEASVATLQAQATTDLSSQLVAGTSVRSRNGTASVGTIKSVDGEFVTLTTAKGDVKFPKSGFSLDAQGVIIGFTADEFNKAIGIN